MWPWSTIRKLRAQLADVRSSWTSVNEKYETLDGLYKAALKAVRTAQDETASVRRELDIARMASNGLVERMDGLRVDLSAALAERDAFESQVADLKAQLAEAMRNDKRDPATGRFVKASA